MGDWAEYVLAWACFLGAHVIPAASGPRGWLIARLGRRGYLIAFSLLSVMLLVWLVRAAGAAPRIELWDADGWSRWMVNLAMPAAILTGVLAVGMSGLIAAFTLWAATHLIANGDLAHVILFGGMLIFALSGLIRLGLPQIFRVTGMRLGLAVILWIALIWLHPIVVGMSPLPG